MSDYSCFGLCPTCQAKPGEQCRTPKGRLKPGVHDTRPFSISTESDLTRLRRDVEAAASAALDFDRLMRAKTTI